MKYRKLLTESRFRTKAPNNFSIDPRTKSVTIGSRGISGDKKAYIGKVLEQSRTGNILDHNVFVDIGFPHVIGIFGSRGSGKSYDLGVLLEGIFLDDTTSSDAAGIVFDIQDQFWTLGYSPDPNLPADEQHVDFLRSWGLAPQKLEKTAIWIPENSDTEVPGAQPFTISASQLTYADWLAILELERYSPMGQGLLSLLEACPGATPTELSERCTSGGVLAGFQQGTIDGLRWRLDSQSSSKLIGEAGVSVEDLLIGGKLTVILMRNLSESLRGLVVGVISRLVADKMGRIQQARKVSQRVDGKAELIGKGLAKRLWMVLDEAHVLVPAEGATAATAPLIDYVKRGRDAGLSLIFATQQPSAVNSKLMSQVDLTLTHMLGFESDLGAATARMPTRTSIEYEIDSQSGGTVTDVIRSLGPGECVVADSASGRIFLSQIRPRTTAHGGATPE